MNELFSKYTNLEEYEHHYNDIVNKDQNFLVIMEGIVHYLYYNYMFMYLINGMKLQF